MAAIQEKNAVYAVLFFFPGGAESVGPQSRMPPFFPNTMYLLFRKAEKFSPIQKIIPSIGNIFESCA